MKQYTGVDKNSTSITINENCDIEKSNYINDVSELGNTWYENMNIIGVLKKIPYSAYIKPTFDILKDCNNMKIKNIVIQDDRKVSDNCYNKKTKTWFLTSASIVGTLRKALIFELEEKKEINMESFDTYIEENGFEIEF